MSDAVVFKQWYKTRADPKTPDLNARHLQYIATRPGAVYNKGCGFGLWGHSPGDHSIQAQMDFAKARQTVRAASKDHTLYRAVISVGKKDAKEHGLYRREPWEKMVNDHIQTIAQQMQIKPENFCWYASMHCAKNHPHVHILYWDNSDEPRNEFTPKPLFEARAEQIRADFSGELHKEDIREAQREQRQELTQLRTALRAMCLEANPEKALNLPRLYKSEYLNGLSKEFAELIRNLPAKGSLRYAYLPADYKALVGKFICRSMMVPELSKEVRLYGDLTQKISRLYSNSELSSGVKLKHAMERLYNALGNEVMAAVRETKNDILLSTPTMEGEARSLIREAAISLAPSLPSYQALLSMLPRERIPVGCMYTQIPEFSNQMNTVIGEVMQDARVRLRLQSYALTLAGIDLTQRPDAPAWKSPAKEEHSETESAEQVEHLDEKEHRFRGKLLTEGEWSAYQKAYKELKKELRAEITAKLREDAGWNEEATRTHTAMTLSNMMFLVSQLAHQRGAMVQQAQLEKTRSRDLSREAKKDRRAQLSQSSEWNDQF